MYDGTNIQNKNEIMLFFIKNITKNGDSSVLLNTNSKKYH